MTQHDVGVSIICTAFNHGKYIRQCLDSLLVQEANFPFEVLVHDDASSDDTALIIREYEEKYPDIIRAIYQKENQYSKGTGTSFSALYGMAQGKYIAYCEGDDCWCDATKLQKQFDALEENPDCALCLTRTCRMDELGESIPGSFPPFALPSGRYESDEFVNMLLSVTEGIPFHQSSFMVTKAVESRFRSNRPDFAKAADFGDTTRLLYCGVIAPVLYIDETTSCYRVGSINGWSYNINHGSIARRVKHEETVARVYALFDEWTDGRYHDACETMIAKRMIRKGMIAGGWKDLKASHFWAYASTKERVYIFLMTYFPRALEVWHRVKA